MFALFLDTWDEAWAKKGGATPGKIKQWAEELAGKTFEELQQAHQKARRIYDYPPTIKQFTELCEKNQSPEGWTHAKAADIADKKTQAILHKSIVNRDFNSVEMTRYIFRDLECRIFETRNDNCDFAVCAIDGCYHYEIFDKRRLDSWLCVKHDNKN